jgi:hypothetical protein
MLLESGRRLGVGHGDDHVRSRALGSDQQGEQNMDDRKVIDRINELAREEHELFERKSQGSATDGDRERLGKLQVTLDQCWDLLRQRRARREFGLDPEDARTRDPRTVEGYTG